LVGVAVLGNEAPDQQGLGRGDRLLTALSEHHVQGRRVSPRALLALLDEGVEVFAQPNLHAKVFLFDDTVVVGSANASWASEHALDEAVTITRAPAIVRAVEQWFEARCGEPVGRDTIEELVPVYDAAPRNRWAPEDITGQARRTTRKKSSRPPGVGRVRGVPVAGTPEADARNQGLRPLTWLCRISEDFTPSRELQDAVDEDLEVADREKGRSRPRGTALDSLVWSYVTQMAHDLRPGDTLIYVWSSEGRDRVQLGGRLVTTPRIVPQRQHPGVSMVVERPAWGMDEDPSMAWSRFLPLARDAGIEVGARERRSRVLTDDPVRSRALVDTLTARLRRGRR
jgi:hypothetical protein